MSEENLEDGSVASDLCTLLESGEGADVTLLVGGTELPVHSQILAARSPVFANMIDDHRPCIKITDMREEVVKELLLFVYSDMTPHMASMADELLAAAEKYDLPLLKDRCRQQMEWDLSVGNATATATLAMQYSCPGLKRAAVQFIANHPEVMASDGWEQVLRDDAETAVQICKQLAVTPSQQLEDLKSEKCFNKVLTRAFTARLAEAVTEGRMQEAGELLTMIVRGGITDSSGDTVPDLTVDDEHQHAHHHCHCHQHHRKEPNQQKAGRHCCQVQ